MNRSHYPTVPADDALVGRTAFAACQGLALALFAAAAVAAVGAWLLPAPLPGGADASMRTANRGLLTVVAILAIASGLLVQWRRDALATWLSQATPARRALALLAGLVLTDLGLGAAFWLTRELEPEQWGWMRAIFFVGAERNLPAIYSALQLALAAALAFTCALHAVAFGRVAPALARATWLAAGAVCAYLSLDELLMLHEKANQWVHAQGWRGDADHSLVSLGGVQVRPWTLLFAPVILGIGLPLAVLFRRLLPPGQRLFPLLVLAGAVYVTGAVGVENLQAHQMATGALAARDTGYHLNLLLEETLEMLGVSLAVYVFARVAFQARACARGRASPTR